VTAHSIKRIVIFGDGLAGLLCLAKLVKVLPPDIELVYVQSHKVNELDIFFGTVTPPSTYDFLLALDITEPGLLLLTNTSFSLGTRYENWSAKNRTWVQSFHRPLPLFNGVGFHHYLTRLRSSAPELSDIEPYIMSVQAAERSVFAHPPEGKKIPLADVQYGYHFLTEDWRQILVSKIDRNLVQQIDAGIKSVDRTGSKIQSVALSDGQTIQADFFINALGPNSKLVADHKKTNPSKRKLRAVSEFNSSENSGGVCRVVTGTDYGWQSATSLQAGTQYLKIYESSSEKVALQSRGHSADEPVEAEIGRLHEPWSENCLAIGHSAGIIEPLTPAPIMLLQRDIDRLAELIPVTADMTVESREYNRRFRNDYDHAETFTEGFFVSDDRKDSPYWQTALGQKTNPKLSGKIEQFLSRGTHVQYDYEPFSAEDWTMLHLGMGRNPRRYDPLANRIPEDQLKAKLSQMRQAIEMMAKKMPLNHIYMSGLIKYLKEKHG